MLDFLTYDLKVAVLIAVFYMFYRLLLARETFHRVNRIVLLLTALASFVLPLCVITMHRTVEMNASVLVEGGMWHVERDMSDAEYSLSSLLLPLASILFIIGVVATLAHTLWSVFRILSLIKHSEQHPQDDGTILCVTGNADLAPFSWMHYIVMNRSDYETRDAAILAHERGHIRLHHSWDVLLVDVLTALQWFNPAIWMLRSDLRAIHEYEADGAVLSQGINARQYQYLLITKAGGIGGYSLANGITHSALKNRINMMLHTKSPRRSLLKLLALVPIVGVTLALNAETVTDVVYKNDEPQKQVPVKKGKKNATIKTGGNQDIQIIETVVDEEDQKKTETEKQDAFKAEGTFIPNDEPAFDVVEEMPQFPGGAPALLEFLSKNIRYPKEAFESNVQGRVLATFVVEKDGSISETKVVKAVDPMLDEEAIRVLNSMPNWTPGKQSGKAVRVKYTVPINFRLDGSKPKENNNAKVMQAAAAGNIFLTSGDPAKTPLVIVDGKEVPYENLKSIVPDDVESINVLKDQAAINLYGEKAKDGVVVFTMKKK
ncbi:MAG: TonB family protein [Prevotella sp.]|nr:TonB family protein [Prevotella sp.]